MNDEKIITTHKAVQHTCYGQKGDQMVRGSNNRPQNSYTATGQEKHEGGGLE